MTDERVERAAFAIYRVFIRDGIGTTISPKETPEQACVRRWRKLPDVTRESFIEEARAALQTLEDF